MQRLRCGCRWAATRRRRSLNWPPFSPVAYSHTTHGHRDTNIHFYIEILRTFAWKEMAGCMLFMPVISHPSAYAFFRSHRIAHRRAFVPVWPCLHQYYSKFIERCLGCMRVLAARVPRESEPLGVTRIILTNKHAQRNHCLGYQLSTS